MAFFITWPLFGGRRKESGTLAKRREMAAALHGLPVRYVTEWRDNNEDVVGRGGYLTLKGDELLVDSSGDVIFRCAVRDLDISHLMSGDGVILRGPNMLDDGRERTITVHFVYYRK